MEPRFFFTQAANVCNPEPWRGRPGILFEGEPVFFDTEWDAKTSARRQYEKGDYDVVLVFCGDWSGRVNLVRTMSRWVDDQCLPPAGYDAAISSTVEDAEFVLKRMLDQHISARS